MMLRNKVGLGAVVALGIILAHDVWQAVAQAIAERARRVGRQCKPDCACQCHQSGCGCHDK